MSDNDQEKVAAEKTASEDKSAATLPSEGNASVDESGTDSTESSVTENAVAEESVAEESVAEESVAEESVAEENEAEKNEVEENTSEESMAEQEATSEVEQDHGNEAASDDDAGGELDDLSTADAEAEADDSQQEGGSVSAEEQVGEDAAASEETEDTEDPSGEASEEMSEASGEEAIEESNDEKPDEPVVIPNLSQIIEGAVLAADKPLSIDHMIQLFPGAEPSRAQIRDAIVEIQAGCEDRGFEFKEVASGYRFQVRAEYGDWIGRLWEEKPPRYTRALLETLALIAYKQPITRGDIEDIRGVSVSTNIIRTLLEREWIRVVGHRDVPGRPSIYATTKTFLDYFNLTSLDELPTLSEIKDLDKLNPELDLEVDLIEPRTLNLEAASDEIEGTEADDESLDSVTDRVNEISENIKNLFKEPEEDELDDEFEDEELEERSARTAETTETEATETEATETEAAETETVEADATETETETVADEVIDDSEQESSSLEVAEDGAPEHAVVGDSHNSAAEDPNSGSEIDNGEPSTEPEQNAGDDPSKQAD